jgi:hypothetical protein
MTEDQFIIFLQSLKVDKKLLGDQIIKTYLRLIFTTSNFLLNMGA